MPISNLKGWLAVLLFPLLAVLLNYQSIKKNLTSYHSNDYNFRSQEPVLGMLSRINDITHVRNLNIAHATVTWRSTGSGGDEQSLKNILSAGPSLITVETWHKTGINEGNVLTDVCQGKFDNQIRQLGTYIAQSEHEVYVRFDPDMEVPVTLYPWQYQSPIDYIDAFNYVASRLKRLAPKSKMVWGPSGYPGDTEYWPGNRYIDAVSITLGSASEYAVKSFAMPATIPEMLKQKLHRMRFINRPVIILGSNKVEQKNFNPEWLKAEAAYITQLSKTAVYSSRNFIDQELIKPARTKLEVGVYDPQEKLINQKHITAEHLFTDLGEVQRNEFEAKFKAVVNRHHNVIVTMEPWKDTSGIVDTNVTSSIMNSRYDAVFDKLFKVLGSTTQTVYLRFMHEMEIPIHRYAWQSQDPVQYIQAYRYFMQFNGGPPPNVKKVWAPAGDRGSVDFWPGDDVVDFISIAIYGLPNKNITDPNQQEVFGDIFKRKNCRMRFLSKPLFIAEFGVKGPEAFQNQWLQDAAATVKANPHVFGVSYFNLYDNSKVWGHMPAPDWSISPRSMQMFINGISH